MTGTVTAPKPSPKPPLKERIQQLMVEYGALAVWVYFSIFALVLAGFWLAIKLGIKPDSAAGTAGTLGAAWVATKLTQPFRIIATLALTPAIMRGLRWFRTRGQTPEAKSDAPTDVTPT
jgi:hypothetical protein